MGMIFRAISDVINMRLQANDGIFAKLTKRVEVQTRHLAPAEVNICASSVSIDLYAVSQKRERIMNGTILL